MALIGITGRSKIVNRTLLYHSIENVPVLFIDCANCANPHKLFPIDVEKLKSVYVVQAELLYMLRDVLRKIPEFMDELKINKLVISTFYMLFNFDNKEENNEMYIQSWKLIKELGGKFQVIVGVHRSQVEFAKQYVNVIGVEKWAIQSGAKELH